MTNITTQEPSRALTNERTANQPVRETAKVTSNSGKSVPEAREEKAEVTSPKVIEQETQRADQVDAAVERLNDYVQSLQRELRFSVDRDLGRAVVSVIDQSTQEVIRQIPNETALRLARNLKDQVDVQQQQVVESRSSANSSAQLSLIDTRI